MGVLSKQQYVILNTCADDEELFYMPFAELNYGGQVSRRSEGSDRSQYVDEGEWIVTVSAEEIAGDLVVLIDRGLLGCWRVEGAPGERTRVAHPSLEEFVVYAGYRCITYLDHIDQYGYGPHEFKITRQGIDEINKPAYRIYDELLGWTDVE
jgi:hypothetical protein